MLVWRSVLPGKKYVPKHPPKYPVLAAATWLRGVSAELQRIAALAAAASGGAAGAACDHADSDPSDGDDDDLPAASDAPRGDADAQSQPDEEGRARMERRGRRPPTS